MFRYVTCTLDTSFLIYLDRCHVTFQTNNLPYQLTVTYTNLYKKKSLKFAVTVCSSATHIRPGQTCYINTAYKCMSMLWYCNAKWNLPGFAGCYKSAVPLIGEGLVEWLVLTLFTWLWRCLLLRLSICQSPTVDKTNYWYSLFHTIYYCSLYCFVTTGCHTGND